MLTFTVLLRTERHEKQQFATVIPWAQALEIGRNRELLELGLLLSGINRFKRELGLFARRTRRRRVLLLLHTWNEPRLFGV